MRRVRRVLGALVAALLAVGATSAIPPARAQDAGASLRLLEQSPWSTADDHATLSIVVLATNDGTEELGDLQLVVSLGPRITTQSAYADALVTGPTSVIATTARAMQGAIAPGASRSVAVDWDLATVSAIDQTDPQVYPAAIQLVSAGTVVATLVTPVIYLSGSPLAPVLTSTTVELASPVAFDASGSLVDTSFGPTLAADGVIGAPLNAIATTTAAKQRSALDLVVDPLTISQARDVADGYRTPAGDNVGADDVTARQAAAFLQTLGAVMGRRDQVETVGNPYAAPLLPAMLRSGLGIQLAAERAAGATVLRSLGAEPATSVIRPAQGAVDDGTLSWLAGTGTSIVLGDADTVDRAAVQTTYAPAPTVPVTTDSGTLTMVLPDPSVQTLFVDPTLLADPVRAAQVVLGELAVIWKQEPVPAPPIMRGIAVAPPASLPAPMWAPLLDRIQGAPFLAPVSATQLVEETVPHIANPALPLAAPSTAAFDATYASEIEQQSDRVEAYASMIDQPDMAATARRSLYVATVPAAVPEPAVGQPWIDAVSRQTQAVFDVATPTVSPRFTFTSREGSIPLLMGDPGDTPVHVTIELRSNAFTFPLGNTQTFTVTAPGQVETFRVVANTSGQAPIQIIARAPNGHAVAEPITIVVRSTAANHIALLVTLAAALGLLALYSRRWFRRRTNPA